MGDERRYTEKEVRERVSGVLDWYCRVFRKYEYRQSSKLRASELRQFIRDAKSSVPRKFQNEEYQRCIDALEKRAEDITSFGQTS